MASVTESSLTKKKLVDLRVVDLRAELDKRSLDKNGVKAALLERLGKALEDEGKDPEVYLFEVAPEGGIPVKKTPSKRTNKKSKDNESQEDVDDDEKVDSDDEKAALEAPDGVEDALQLSIGDEEKLLNEEEDKGADSKEKVAEEEEQDATPAKSEKQQAEGKEPLEKTSGDDTGGERQEEESGEKENEEPKEVEANSTTGSEAAAATSDTAKAKSAAESKDGKVVGKDEKVKRVAGKNLWISGLSSSTRATDLKTLFSKHGKVVGAKIVTNARTPGARCYGFVTMATIEEASKCIQHLHRTELHGRMISVERTRHEPGGALKRSEAKTATTAKKLVHRGAAKAATGEVKKSETAEGEEKAEGEKADEEKPAEGEEEEKEAGDGSASEKEEGAEGKSAKEGEKGKEKSRERRRSKEPSSRFRDYRSGPFRPRSFDFRGRGRGIFRPGTRDMSFRKPFFPRRPFPKPGFMGPYKGNMSFMKMKEDRFHQRQREWEIRENERREAQEIYHQREMKRKHREEAFRLERERERLRMERERLERERAEVLRLEREKQRMERERLEREREELRHREQMSRSDGDPHRPVKRHYEGRGVREADPYWEERKRAAMERFENNAQFRDGPGNRMEWFEREGQGGEMGSNHRMGRGGSGRGFTPRGRDRMGPSDYSMRRPRGRGSWRGPQGGRRMYLDSGKNFAE